LSRSPDPYSLVALALVPVAAVVLGAGLWVTLRPDSGATGGAASPDTAFRAPAQYELAGLERTRPFRCAASDTACTRRYLVDLTAAYGPRASLALLQRFQRSDRVDVSLNDHDLAHAVGRETAERFGSNFRSFDLCPITFNYGCPHGFFEYVLGRTDTPNEAAVLVCESVRGGNRLLTAGFSCYHGVGHGVMMAEAYDLPASLATCNTLKTPQAREGCWQGVFMENVNAGVQGKARQGVFSRRDPLAPCSRVSRRYQRQCFLNHAGYLMFVSSNELERAVGYCRHAPAPHASTCAQSIGLMVTNPVWQANLSPHAGKAPVTAIAWELCRRFPAGLRRDCVVAGVDNLANFDQLDVGRSASFCGYAEGGLKPTCYRQIGVNLRARTTRETLIRRGCSTLPRRHRASCLEAAGVAA
jgi:hypothetical protein